MNKRDYPIIFPLTPASGAGQALSLSFTDRVAIGKTSHVAVFVIPVPDQVRDDGPGIQCFSRVLRFWMPDPGPA